MKNYSKTIRSIGFACLCIALTCNTGLVQAAGPSGSYQSEIVCGNLDATTAAAVQIVYYPEDGSASTTFDDSLNPLGPLQSKVYVVSAPAGFKGAAVVNSNTDMACSINLSKTGADGTQGNPARIAASEGVSSANVGEVLYASQVVKGLGNASSGIYNAYYSVQNTDPAADVVVDISYTSRLGVTTASSFSAPQRTVKPNASKVFYVEDDTAVPTGFIGGVKVVGPAGSKLAGTVVMFNDGSALSKNQLLAYSMVTAGANKLTVPQFVVNYFGFNTGFNVQNVDSVAAVVNIAFTMANGVTYNEGPINLAPGNVYAPFAPGIASLAPMAQQPTGKRTGSAIITSTGGKIISNVNLRHDGQCYQQAGADVDCNLAGVGANNVGGGTAFLAFADGTATTKVFIPDYRKHVGGGSFTSGLKVVNSTGSATTCDIAFPGQPSGTANITGKALPANGAFDLFAGSAVPSLADGYSNSVSITCGQPVFSNFNMRSENASYFGDATTTANAVNLP